MPPPRLNSGSVTPWAAHHWRPNGDQPPGRGQQAVRADPAGQVGVQAAQPHGGGQRAGAPPQQFNIHPERAGFSAHHQRRLLVLPG